MPYDWNMKNIQSKKSMVDVKVGDIDRKSGVPYSMRWVVANRMRLKEGRKDSTIPSGGVTTSCRHQVRGMKSLRFVSMILLSDQPLQIHVRRIPFHRGLGQEVRHGLHRCYALQGELLVSLPE